MRSLTIGELFTEQQLRKAADVFSKPNPLGLPVHPLIVSILTPDKKRFDKLEVDVDYAAYLLESHRNLLIHVYL